MPASIDRYTAFEAASHPAQRCAMLTLHRDAKRRDAESEQRGGKGHSLRNLVSFAVDDDLDEPGHQWIPDAVDGIARIGEKACARIGAVR